MTSPLKPRFNAAVRAMVAHVLRSGDLHSDFMGSVSALEGIRAHQRIQRKRPADYQPEVSVKRLIDEPEFELSIGGRIDGVYCRDGRAVVEEIKTTRRPLQDIEADPSPVHWGQVQCYAFMWALQEDLDEVDVQLTYVNLDSGRLLELVRRTSRAELTRFAEDLIGRYLQWVRLISRCAAERDQSIASLAFPFDTYRPGQREMAVEVFRAIRDSAHMLVQAATGIGKTMAALYPALQALGRQLAPKVVFLTARTTGRLAAQAALQRLAQQGLRLKWVSLTAKEKICLSPDTTCAPEECPFARGYFDRLNNALAQAFEQDALTRDVIEDLARRHQVCPFEFSLELVQWADCVIGDYNYAFDPHVTLKRLFGEDAARPVVLVDEAHNLVDRARDMFSAQLTKAALQSIRQALKPDLPKLYRALGPINAWVTAAGRRCRDGGGLLVEKELPQDLIDKLRAFMAKAESWLQLNLKTGFREALLTFYFDCLRFVRIAERYGSGYATIMQAAGKQFQLKLFCMDPAEQLKACWERCRAAVLFSATLTPADYFQAILGCKVDTRRLNLPSPFPPSNFGVFVASRISTLYRLRQASCKAVSDAIAHLVLQRRGHYLVFFPSYDYLAMVRARFAQDHPAVETWVQASDMDEQQKETFLARFNQQVSQTLVGFAVLGGVFGEGIDLQGDRLTGAVVVGVGLPGIGPERDLIREYYDRELGCGFEYAYQYPGINRVLQAAGRVIRSETDRGVVLLIDDRYAQSRYRTLLPPAWHVQKVACASGLQQQLAAFWDSSGL